METREGTRRDRLHGAAARTPAPLVRSRQERGDREVHAFISEIR
jgi:hypothetical protein